MNQKQTPWRVTRINGKRECLVNSSGGRITYIDDDCANFVEHAVRCVNVQDDLMAALNVIVKTTAIRTFLQEHDPMALRQVEAAIDSASKS